VCIKGHMNLPVDISCCLCWGVTSGSYTGSHTLSTHIYLWIFPSCYAWHLVSSVVGLWASWLPQSAPRVNPCVNVNSTKVYPWHSWSACVRLEGRPHVGPGGPGLLM